MSACSPTIRVACVGYTNAWPLTRHLDPGAFDVVPCIPSVAARMLARREVDVGLVPIASLFDGGMDVRIVPGLAIGCDGDVASVLFVGERPLSEWTEVVLDGESRTSVILAQILLRGPLGRPDLAVRPVDPGTGSFHAQGTVGAVIIGDAARNVPERLTTRIDLGRVWRDWTGLPFVFAVWAGRPDLPVAAIEGLRRAAERGLPERELAGPADKTYLTEHVRYALDDRAIMGLRRFVALAQQAGLLGDGELSLYGPPARAHLRSAAALLDRPASTWSASDTLRVATESSTGELVALAARARVSGGEVAYAVGAAPGAERVAIGCGETVGDRLAALRLALVGAGASGRVRIEAPDRFGFDAGASADALLRTVALARILAPPSVGVGIQLAPEFSVEDLGVAQAALCAGADELGVVPEGAVADVEHHVRVAGFVPVRVRADGTRERAAEGTGRYAWSEERPAGA